MINNRTKVKEFEDNINTQQIYNGFVGYFYIYTYKNKGI